MEMGAEYMFSGLGAVSCVTGFSDMMAHIPGGDRMCKVIHRMQRVEWGPSVKRSQMREQRVFPGYCGGNNYRHKYSLPEAIVNMAVLEQFGRKSVGFQS